MSTFIELEIQNLLKTQTDLEQIGTHLIVALEEDPEQRTPDNVNSLSRFLTQAGLYRKLVDFVLRHLDQDSFPTPWPYFLQAISQTTEPLDDKIVKALIEGLQEQNAEGEAARAESFHAHVPQMHDWKITRKYKIQKEYLENKRNLLDQLITLRTQQLYEQEKSLLHRLMKLYPGDREIQKEMAEHKQRYALEILSRKSPKAKTLTEEDFFQPDPELDKAVKALMISLKEHAADQPDMAFDFAIVAYMLEQYQDCVEILGYVEEITEAYLWFHLESLLKARRFVEVLQVLTQVELELAHDPETFFATAYLRAQAYWGLGQKHTAVEVMEGLLASRPHYRAASALMSLWGQQ